MKPEEIMKRTFDLAVRIIRLTEALPKSRVSDVIARQLIRCGTSVGANYRAACRARSRADFIAKLGIVEEETDECQYWLDLIVHTGLMHEGRVAVLKAEAGEILAIMVASIRTARSHK